MPSILDPLPQELRPRFQALSDNLDIRIPAKKIGRNLLIATWNIRAFGNLSRVWTSGQDDSPRRDISSLKYITEIISRFDVIAVQEVKANIRAFRDMMKLLGPNWSFILTDVTAGSAGNGERMAYVFDTRRVNLSGLASEIVVPQEWLEEIDQNALREQFVRSPYAVSFRSESKTFILVTLHVIYGKKSKDRIAELKGIARWLSEWATNINAYDQNLICLGDFNIDERGDLLDKTFLAEGLHVPPALQAPEATRSIFNKDKYYDQIAWFDGSDGKPKLSMDLLAAGNYDFVPLLWNQETHSKLQHSWMISDHYPLWTEFSIR
ncbi:endonuclease/exonuclease/phosphatase family protein [Neolewinella agarilytica]|uniref:Endonuclease/Exonuclease/phosphatase family protein n=1 Tax=Neolewinella agarilytica TaxID=478744 RepID=A0A1H9H7I2_9BACT|nr:endonuclease/exonuclease/phosphatase family protein [Neolewinella agarilytica]SEQ58321.1 Endonuclease/Exonuclease/phosphatase family protein [Neolewinella agarilytica]